MSRRLLTVFGAIVLICGYFLFAENMHSLAIPTGIALALAITVFIMKHEIDLWWYRRYPPKLDEEVRMMYTAHSGMYKALTDEEKIEFGKRATLYVTSKEFIGMGIDSVPEDVKYIMAYYATKLTWSREDEQFDLDGYDRIVCYLHPFLSPHYPEQVHIYEVEHVDGTLIFALDPLMAGFMSPQSFYQTGLHATAEAYAQYFGIDSEALFDDGIWDTLHEISGISKEKIVDYTGMAQEDPWPVAVHHYFTYDEKFKKHAPELFAKLEAHFPSFRSLHN